MLLIRGWMTSVATWSASSLIMSFFVILAMKAPSTPILANIRILARSTASIDTELVSTNFIASVEGAAADMIAPVGNLLSYGLDSFFFFFFCRFVGADCGGKADELADAKIIYCKTIYYCLYRKRDRARNVYPD